jgi:DNA replication protein DnaC
MLEESSEPGACATCGGSGWLIRNDGGAGTAWRCSCRRTAPRRVDLAAAAEIPPRYRGCGFDSFRTSGDSGREQLLRALSQCRRYVETFFDGDTSTFRDSGLLFVGPPGVGKTHLAIAVLLELMKSFGVVGRFVDFTRLIHDIQSTFDSQTAASKGTVLEPILTAEVLVLDELGALKPSPWVSDILYLVINTRYAQRLPTLYTTNYRLEGKAASLDRGPDPDPLVLLSSRVPPALLSRLYEMTRPILLDAVGDYRREIQAHQHLA